jgi:hypothetical protein
VTEDRAPRIQAVAARWWWCNPEWWRNMEVALEEIVA